VKTVALVGKRGSTHAASLARDIHARYPSLRIIAERHLSEALGWAPAPDDRRLLADAELVVVLGGDGTLIHAARLVAGRPIPILGVNLGSLGFMTEIPQAELFDSLDAALEGKLTVNRRMKLRVRLWRDQKVLIEDEVLNDVVINKGALARIADHEASIDGEYVTTYKSDGVIISTPTGSTAYALSAGGPIVHPALEAIILAPICPHALTQRAIVVPSEKVLSIVIKSEVADVFLTIDGQEGYPLRMGDRLEVDRSPNPVLILRNPKLGYFSILRQKLHWGER
jgi:NAD+ kinase